MNNKRDIIAQIQSLKSQGKTISFVSGNFNIIHPGHLRFLLFAAEQADLLIVGLYDKHDSIGAYFSNDERTLALKALNFVSEVIVVNGDRLDVLAELQPDIVVKGKEFVDSNNIEKEIIENYGGKLIFSSGEKLFSSRELLQQQLSQNDQLSEKLQRYHHQYNLDANTLTTFLDSFSQLKVAVLGDIIVDEYQECLAIGMSQEDPTIAVSPLESFQYLGGAGIVAGHASSLGADVTFYSITGNDQNAKFAQSKLKEYAVKAELESDSSRPTTHKLRFRAKDKTLLRVNTYRRHDIDTPLVNRFVDKFRRSVTQYDLVIFADFNLGMLSSSLVEQISAVCIENKVPMIADSQTSSQIGDLAKFSHLLLTTPTEIEARQATQDDDNGLIQVSKDLAEQLVARNVIVTLGAEGILIRHLNAETQLLDTDNLPALSDTAIDTAGAGDAMFVTAGLMLAAGATIWQAAFVGSISSAIQVNVRGNVPITKSSVVEKIARMVG